MFFICFFLPISIKSNLNLASIMPMFVTLADVKFIIDMLEVRCEMKPFSNPCYGYAYLNNRDGSDEFSFWGENSVWIDVSGRVFIKCDDSNLLGLILEMLNKIVDVRDVKVDEGIWIASLNKVHVDGELNKKNGFRRKVKKRMPFNQWLALQNSDKKKWAKKKKR